MYTYVHTYVRLQEESILGSTKQAKRDPTHLHEERVLLLAAAQLVVLLAHALRQLVLLALQVRALGVAARVGGALRLLPAALLALAVLLALPQLVAQQLRLVLVPAGGRSRAAVLFHSVMRSVYIEAHTRFATCSWWEMHVLGCERFGPVYDDILASARSEPGPAGRFSFASIVSLRDGGSLPNE